MKKNIKKYCKFCFVCQKMRIHYYKLYNNLFFIILNDVELFTIVTFDFIIDMSFAKNFYTKKTYNSILIFVDKLIKHAIYIAYNKILNAKNLVDLLWKKFVYHYDIMKRFILNKKLLFINHFWFIFCWHLNAKRKLNIAFYSQINKQIKKQNQILKHYLRIYCNYIQNNWSKLLFIITFVYNNNVHANTQKTSNELLLNYIATFDSKFENKFKKKHFSQWSERNDCNKKKLNKFVKKRCWTTNEIL